MLSSFTMVIITPKLLIKLKKADMIFYVSVFSVGLDLVLESSEDYITAELDKQKRRLREMSQLIEQQHTLVRLIVQVRLITMR